MWGQVGGWGAGVKPFFWQPGGGGGHALFDGRHFLCPNPSPEGVEGSVVVLYAHTRESAIHSIIHNM